MASEKNPEIDSHLMGELTNGNGVWLEHSKYFLKIITRDDADGPCKVVLDQSDVPWLLSHLEKFLGDCSNPSPE